MKKGISDKDLLLLAGIVVAVIVALTTWVYTDRPAETSRFSAPKNPAPISAPAATVKKIAGEILHAL